MRDREPYAIREVFAHSLDDFLEDHYTSRVQRDAANAIADCKTGRLGVNFTTCDECGYTEAHNCSCRNRNCPNCQGVMKDVWVEQRRAEVIDARYFHAVFTVPHSLNALFLSNQVLLYKLLFSAASRTLLTLSRDEHYLGAEPGIIMVLHTWSRTLDYHPHVHCIISGAGLTRDHKLKLSGEKFFIPIRAAMKMFRGKFMEALRSYHDSGKLVIPDSCSELRSSDCWNAFVSKLYSTDWCPYIKETMNGSGDAIKYLGRYTNRIAISNARITDVTGSTVTFWYKDRKDHNIRKEMTLSHEEFIRKFLMHVLPKGFQKIRYYGYLSNPVKKKKLRILFDLQGRQLFKARFSMDTSKDEILKILYGIDVHICPRCGKSALRSDGSRSILRE